MKIHLTASVILLVLFTGCAPQPVISTASPSSQVPATESAPTSAPTDIPPPTPTAEPGKVMLVSASGADFQQLQAVVNELSAASGLTLETVPDLQPGGAPPGTRIVLLPTLPANLNDLLSSAPQAQFVVIAEADVPVAANLTVLRQPVEFQAFVGGFISVLLSTDWRSGGLLPTDNSQGAALQDAFINGGRYFCGTCAAGWPLGIYYPQVGALPSASDGSAWQAAAADLFDNKKVEAYYLSKEALKPEVISYLQGKDQFGKLLILTGDQAPPDELRDQWAATVSFDTFTGLREVWPDLLNGKGGVVVETELIVSDVNPQNLGEGRLRLVNELIAEIQAGKIYPFSLPAE